MKLLLRFFGFLFAAGTVVFVVAVGAGAGLVWHFSKDLPDYSQLQDYEPPVMTRVHAADGSLLAEYARERRLYLPIQAVPKLVVNAFIAAEDKNFYDHGGLDFGGIMRAGLIFVQNYGSSRRPQGASTITQQVAKNFLLTNEVSFERKAKEALLALRIERTYSKEKILELYLNEIYLGFGAYGVAAASLIYFDKSVHELSLAEAAYLAALPKAPNNYHPFRQRERAIERRNYVLDRMAEDRYITPQEGEKAKKEPLNITPRPPGAHIFAAEYFAEEVRREIYERYGEKKLYEGGLSVRATLDPKMQVMARKALADGLVRFDEAQGWRGPVTKIDISGDWGATLVDVKTLADIGPWRLAVVSRSGRLRLEGAASRHCPARRREVGEGCLRAEPLQADNSCRPSPATGRRDLCRAPQQRGQAVPIAAASRGVWGDCGDGPLDRPSPRAGRGLFLRSEPVQPREPSVAPARVFVQAIRIRRRTRQRIHTLDRRARCADRDRSGSGHARMAAGKLFPRQVLRRANVAIRHRAVA